MSILRKIWPYSFTAKRNVVALIIAIALHLVGEVVAGLVIGLLSQVPVVGFLFSIVGSLLGVYVFVGIVLCVLDFFNVLK